MLFIRRPSILARALRVGLLNLLDLMSGRVNI